MDQLFRLKDTFIQYLSPAKRRRTTGPATPSNDAREHTFLTPISEPRDRRAQAIVLDHVSHKYLSPSDTKNPRKRAREDYEEDDNDSGVGPEDSISQGTPSDDGDGSSNDTSLIEEEVIEEEDDAEIAAREEAENEAKVQEYLARQAELALIREDVEKARASGTWHPDELFLYERLAMRSFEELLPQEWQIDFRTLPELLFTKDEEKTFINSNCISRSRGVKALQSLLSLGMRVREKVEFGGSVEKLVSKEIANYIKWSEKDGGFSSLRFLPVLTVVAGRPKQTPDSMSDSLTKQLKFLAEKHREHLAHPDGRLNELGEVELYTRQPPLLYGILVAQTVVMFVTLDSSNPNASVRHFNHFNFKDKDMDVWNGFALAFIVIVARNYIMSIKDELEEDDVSVSDVDA